MVYIELSALTFNEMIFFIYFPARLSRNLYSMTALGIDGFLSARERTKLQISNVDSFKLKMQEFVNDENSKNLIFTEDLKSM